MAITITFTSEKGGVGKTTLATMLAFALARRGERVLLADADPQGHSTVRSKLRKANGFKVFIDGGVNLKDIVRLVPPSVYAGDDEQPTLFVIPGADGTSQIPTDIPALTIKQRIEPLHNAFDWILFDTNPALGAIHLNLYLACDFVLHPVGCTFLDTQGAINTIEHLRNVQAEIKGQYGDAVPVARSLGIIPNKYDDRKKLHSQFVGRLMGKYEDDMSIYNPIALRTAWEKAEARRQDIQVYNPRTIAAREANQLVQEIMEDLKYNHEMDVA